jgi:hypothetical protein
MQIGNPPGRYHNLPYLVMLRNKVMKPSLLDTRIFLMIVIMLLYACDKIIIIEPRPSSPVHQRNEKPRTPLPLGCIRGYFGDDYLTFTQHIEKVQPIDSFSNCYFYGSCNNTLKQINLIRCDSTSVIALYILGYSVDSLPASLPVPSEFGKFAEIQFYSFQDWNSTSAGHYTLNSFYGENVFITGNTDDVLTGTFKGVLRSPSGNTVQASEGEFKLKILRKYMPCGQ